MNKLPHLFLILFLFTIAGCQQSGQQKTQQANNKQKAPNIIFILTDDLGYGDLGILFQNERQQAGKPYFKTPNLDRLAGEGMLLTRHYVPAPVCAPSRASLMLGLHQGHANIRNNQFDKALANNHTVATVLKKAGYATGLVGKWGLQGLAGNSPETWEAYPTKRGFDYFLGYVRHKDGHNHYPAHQALERPQVELYKGNEEISRQLKGVYTTDLFTAAAKKWIMEKEQSSPDQPFFLYLAYDTPHAGLQVASSPYPEGGGIKGGVQWTGDKEKFINTVTDTVDTYIHPDYARQNWPEVQKRFASMVRRIDDGVGDLLQLLKDLNIDEETLIVFTSDNGPHKESYGYGEYDPVFFDSYGPLDGIKRDVWEGGIRVPTFVRWPQHIAAKSSNDTPSGFHDWLPTFAQLAGVPAPANTDGVSLVPLLTDKGKQQPGSLYIEYKVDGKTPEYEVFHPAHKGQAHGEMQVIYLDGYKGIRTNILSVKDDFQIYETKNLAGSSTYFTNLQKRMKSRVLQIRRPDTSAVRPYDNVPIPPVDSVQNINQGLIYHMFEISTPWTPNIRSLVEKPAKTGVSQGIDLSVRTRDKHIVLAYTGLLEIPTAGEYTFYLQTDRGAVLRLHEATLIDADKEYKSGTEQSAVVYLEKGHHPIKLVYARASEGVPQLHLQWSGPGLSKQVINSQHWFHDNGRAKAGL